MWEGDSFPAEFLQRKASHIFLNSMIYTGWRFFQIWSNFSRILSFFFFFIGLSIFSVQLFSYGFFNTKSPIRISFFFFFYWLENSINPDWLKLSHCQMFSYFFVSTQFYPSCHIQCMNRLAHPLLHWSQ